MMLYAPWRWHRENMTKERMSRITRSLGELECKRVESSAREIDEESHDCDEEETLGVAGEIGAVRSASAKPIMRAEPDEEELENEGAVGRTSTGAARLSMTIDAVGVLCGECGITSGGRLAACARADDPPGEVGEEASLERR